MKDINLSCNIHKRTLNMSHLNATESPIIDSDTFEDYSSFYYDGNIDKLKNPWVKEPHFLPLVIVYGFVFLAGIVGNSIVIFAMRGGRSARSVTFVFMVSLALADLLFILVCVPHEILRMTVNDWTGGQSFCKVSGFVELLTEAASILNLTGVSFERFVVIVMPMRSRTKCTLGKSRKVLLVIWLVGIILSTPSLILKDTETHTFYNNNSNVTLSFCSEPGLDPAGEQSYAIYQLLVLFAIPTVLIVFCYAVVIYVLWISGHNLAGLTANNRSRHSQYSRANDNPMNCRQRISHKTQNTREHKNNILNSRKQIIKMLIIIVLIFVLCRGPKFIMQVLKRLYPVDIQTQAGFNLMADFQLRATFKNGREPAPIVIHCLPYVKSTINPFVYVFMSRNFRRSIVTSCTKWDLPSTSCRTRDSPGTNIEMKLRTKNASDVQTLPTRLCNQNSASSES